MMNEKSQSVWMEDGDRRGDVSPWEENVSGRPDLNRPENNGNAMTEGEGAGRGSAQPVMGSAPGNADTHSAEKETSKDRNVQPGMGSAAGSRTAQQGTGSAAGSGTAQQGMEGRFVNGDVQKAVGNNAWGAPAPGANRPAQGNPARMETEETKRMKDNFDFFGPAAFLYAVFYVFCMFRNGSGITFPFFVGGSLLFMCLSLSKLGITLKKGSVFYMAAMVLLGISTFCTGDARIIFYNKLGCFLLMMSLLLKQFCNTQNWKLGKYLVSIIVMVIASIGELNRPVADAAAYRKSGAKKMDRRVWYAGLGLLLGIPLMLVVLLLLASADAVFRQMTKSIPESINLFNIFSVLWRIAFVYFASYALIAWLCSRQIKDEVVDRRNGEPVLAITVTGLLTLLYLVFSGIQIGALFLGRMHLPYGYTYAMYAREGYFQLLFVSILNLIIVLVCMSCFRESKVLKVILTIMSLCTFVMIASSAMRMIIYIRYYYLTFLRILVLWSLALLAVLLAGVVINIMKETFPLFRYSVAVVAVMYLALSFAHPDYIIARVNVANAFHSNTFMQSGNGRNRVSPDAVEGGSQKDVLEGSFFLTSMPYQDYFYLRGLSADAAPVLIPYLKELGYDMEAFYAKNAVVYAKDKEICGGVSEVDGFGYYWMRHMQEDTENFGIRTYNISRHMALEAFRRQRQE